METMKTTKMWKQKIRSVGLATIMGVAAVGVGVVGSAASADPAEASNIPFESGGDVNCRVTESDTNYNIIISRQVFNDHGCDAFGKNEKQLVYSHTCGTCDESQPVIEESDLTSATKSSGCVQLEYWGTSPHGYDYLPNGECLESPSDGYFKTGIRICSFYLESKNEDVFFPRQALGDTSVNCNQITIHEESTDTTYTASNPPSHWKTAHEDTWPHPGEDDTDGLVNLRRCYNFTHFLELTNHTADVCSHMGEPIDSSTRAITTAHKSLHTLPQLHGKVLPNPEPGVAPTHQVYSILAGDALEIGNEALHCTAGPQMTWKENNRQMYGMAIPSHCAEDGIGSIVHKTGRGFASVIGYDLTRKIGEVVAISDTYDLALVEYYWVDCSNINCVEYEIRGATSIRTGNGRIWNHFAFLTDTHNWNPLQASEGKIFDGYGSGSNTTYTGEFTLNSQLFEDEDGLLINNGPTTTVDGDSGGPIWYANESTGALTGTNSIAGMNTSKKEFPDEPGRPDQIGFVRSDTILSWTQSLKGTTAKFVTWSS